ncbi:MAG: translocation/assembly module TamB domain-containing protein [Chitinophagaceae bacterium]|nr:translocation/assembly module TamB domain-containing protein [Chitinophagaceae bacterium]
MLVIVLVIGLLAFAIQTAIIQNWLVDIATKKLSKDLNSKVEIKSVSFSLFNKANINDVLVLDRKSDTLLHAGSISLQITDWFFLKNNVTISYLGINNALIKMNREDSVWNYQYIINHFASDKPSTKKSSTNYQIQKLDFSNIHIIKHDAWRGETLTIKFKDLLVEAKHVNFNKNIFEIDNIQIEEPFVDIQKFDGNRPANYIFPPPDLTIPENLLQLTVKQFNIKNGILLINNDFDKPIEGFDGAHIWLSKLNIDLDRFNVHGDTLKSIININAVERSGLLLKQLKANLKWTPRILELANFDLLTNKSHLTNYYAMKFNNFDDDFAEYATNVTMQARFRNAFVSSDDIAFFTADLKNWKKELQLDGNFYGTVSDFNFTNLFAKEKNNGTTISGNLSMKGLPDIDKTFIGFNNGEIKTNHKDLSAIIPSLKDIQSPNLTALGTILFKGSFNGTTSKFNTNSTITTAIGSLISNINMQLPTKKEATYNGTLNFSQFHLGKFLNNQQLGMVDFVGNFDGFSFNVEKLKTKLEGAFNKFEYNGYGYNNIITNGTFQNKYFNGELKITDPNFDFIGNAEADFSKELPQFNILADLKQSNLKALNFSNEPLSLIGLLDINFTGTNIDNFKGSAKFLNASISNKNATIKFDSLNLFSDYYDSTKYLHLASNDFSANIYGDFKILDLPNAFQHFLHNYYPAYIAAPKGLIKDQQFKFDLTTRYVEPYLQLFDKKIKGFNDARLSGIIDTKDSKFDLDLLMPYGRYNNFEATGLSIKGRGNIDTLSLTGVMNNFKVSDSLNFPNTKISITSHKDLSNISLKTSASNTLNDANLNAIVETSTNGVKIKFNPSSFVLNDKRWNLDKEGEINLTKNLTEAKKVKFIQGFQEISIETSPDEGGNTSSLDIVLKNVVAGDLTSLFLKDLKIEGITNGNIHVDDVFGKINAFANLKIDQFRIDTDSVGVAYIKSNYNSRTGLISANIISPNKDYNFTIDGLFDVKANAVKPINTILNLSNSKIDLVQKLIGYDVFSNLKGYATGNLNISGSPSELDLAGKVNLTNASLKVNYTQVKYLIDSALISFDKDGIDFGEFIIKDTLGNIGNVRGKLYEKHFKKLTFDFDLSTNKLLLINTSFTDNNLFYGHAIGKATLIFKGPEDNCKMIITSEANEASHFTIPNSNSRETSDASFIVFRPIGVEMTEVKKQSNFNLSVDLDLIANNKVDFDVILDEVTGDVIKAKGNGRIKIKVGTNEDLDIRGKYNIEEGSYDFNFQSFIRKPFILKKGDNNFIEWSGSPYDANVHIDAMFEAKNISIKELIGNAQASFNTASRNYRDDVYVIATLTGKLMQPDIKFRFDFPQNSPIKNDDVFDRFRRKIESDENEMLKQVTYLIVFNSFAPYGDASVEQTNFTSIGVNSISSILTRQINKTFTNLLYKITNDKSLAFDLSSNVYSSNDLFSQGNINATSSQFDRYNLKFKIGKSFFSDKVRFTFGSDFDINLRSSAQSGNFQWLPDWNVEWSLTNDKNLVLIVFSKNSLDISGNSLGRRNRQGIGISYKKDFDNSPFEKKNKQIEFVEPKSN